MNLEDLRIYKEAMRIGEEVWEMVMKWDYFQKDTIGKQLVRSADSVAINISEGFGRYHYKDTKNFSYYSRGSLYETKSWLTKAHNRSLLSATEFNRMINTIETLTKMLNSYIRTTGYQQPVEDNGE